MESRPIARLQTSPSFWFMMRTHVGPSFIKAVVDGAALRRPSHLRAADTADLKDKSNSLRGIGFLESEASPPHTSKDGIGIRPACFLRYWQNFAHSFDSREMMPKSIWWRRDVPAVFVDSPKAPGKAGRWDFDIFVSDSDFSIYAVR